MLRAGDVDVEAQEGSLGLLSLVDERVDPAEATAHHAHLPAHLKVPHLAHGEPHRRRRGRAGVLGVFDLGIGVALDEELPVVVREVHAVVDGRRAAERSVARDVPGVAPRGRQVLGARRGVRAGRRERGDSSGDGDCGEGDGAAVVHGGSLDGGGEC
ncbi:MAG: hypothetical protein AVDCRST_MAG85-4118 [uncultured Solirubrobacteraceae bacterium]|uniref:Uncharacterized protein n=1 Tax=uncultured Solirubrobacteraceae bacterium TaxID=1162706 RepID=A0A6J4TYN5_9ACTN|nr:MAG: hypothetical protein AVDCRST_MAG85-4118 [uncultured Solirubrobacteraceae bacterium]